MKKSSLGAVAFLTLVRIAAANEIADLIQEDRNAIAGIWQIDYVELDGQKSPNDPKGPKFTVMIGSNGALRVQQGDRTVIEANTEINPTKVPKSIDIHYTTGGRKGQSSLGIYEIDGNTLRVCTSRSGNGRPAAFTFTQGSGQILTVYKRLKSR